jgi:hypothetical protein
LFFKATFLDVSLRIPGSRWELRGGTRGRAVSQFRQD